MIEYKLEFPSLKFIKSHKRHPNPKDKDEYAWYKWTIFNFGNSYCRITYNEDDNGKLFLDMMQCGYCDQWEPFGSTYKSYPATKDGYKELCDRCQFVYDKLIYDTLTSNNRNMENWK